MHEKRMLLLRLRCMLYNLLSFSFNRHTKLLIYLYIDAFTEGKAQNKMEVFSSAEAMKSI